MSFYIFKHQRVVLLLDPVEVDKINELQFSLLLFHITRLWKSFPFSFSESLLWTWVLALGYSGTRFNIQFQVINCKRTPRGDLSIPLHKACKHREEAGDEWSTITILHSFRHSETNACWNTFLSVNCPPSWHLSSSDWNRDRVLRLGENPDTWRIKAQN